jgi:hypothetical protein
MAMPRDLSDHYLERFLAATPNHPVLPEMAT